MGLQGKTAVILGGETGFGAGIARALAEAGGRVMVAGRDGDAARALARECGGLWAETDPCPNMSVAALAYKAADLLGDIDIVVNAGVGATKVAPSDEWPEADFDADLVNVLKPVYLSARHFLPALKARRSGVILNILGPAKTGLVWADAARGWMQSATASMALELAPFGIRVNAVSLLADMSPTLPSFLGGKRNEDRARRLANIPLGRFTTPDDIGPTAVYLCSDASGQLTGIVLNLNGGAGL